MPDDKIDFPFLELMGKTGVLVLRKRNLVYNAQGSLVDIEYPIVQRIGRNESEKICQPETLIWTIAGHDVTGRAGEVAVNLSEKLPCHKDGQEFIGGDPYFVATPISERPALLTTTIETTVIPNPNEHGHWVPLEAPGLLAVVTVASWDTNGERLGGVQFNWACVARLTQWVYGYYPVP